MQADVNKTKSRSYNFFLRHFHMGLRILAVIFSTRIVDQYESCPQTFSKFVLPLAISLTVLNLAFMVYFLCRDTFPRCQFFLFSSVNIVLSSVIGLLTYSYFNNGVRCKKNMILQSYIVLQIIFNIPICLLALMAKFSWAQRYTNTPGNLIWSIVIISFAQDMSFVPQIQAVAWITALISVSSLILNIVTLITGITPSIKKAILIQWVISLVLIVVCAFMALVVFLNNYLLKQYANQILSNICLKYILVAIIDVGFWIWGLLTLTYENGDYIRNAILNNSYHDHDQGKNETEPYFDGEWFNINHGFAPLKST